MSVRLCFDVATADTDDGTVLLNERTGRYWQLNATGAEVLLQLLAGHTPSQVANKLAERHRIEVNQAQQDVTAVIDQLQAAGLAEAQ